MSIAIIEISVRTPEREVLVDITERVEAAAGQARPGFSGLVSVFVPHTTAGVTINEGADPSVIRDIVESLRRLIPRDAGYRHVEGNSDAHIKASLMGSSVLVPLENGRVRLGTWQSIYLTEFDGPRNRRVWVIPVTSAD
jgi:secondary thiamine-phosphate synthase enzyme